MVVPFQTLHHLCLVVHDLDDAVDYYTRLGIGPWREFANPGAFAELSMPNSEAFFALKYRMAQVGGVQIQLCQPPQADCPQRRFLDSRGPGVFHIGFESGDVDSAQQGGEAVGLAVLMRGRRRDGTGFTYFDTEDATGTTLMVRSATPRPIDGGRGTNAAGVDR